MENILLTLNVVLAIILIILVLVQKSEGGALGIGISQDNFMFSRSAGNFLTERQTRRIKGHRIQVAISCHGVQK